MQLGAMLGNLGQNLGLEAWKMTSCVSNSVLLSVEDAFMEVVRDLCELHSTYLVKPKALVASNKEVSKPKDVLEDGPKVVLDLSAKAFITQLVEKPKSAPAKEPHHVKARCDDAGSVGDRSVNSVKSRESNTPVQFVRYSVKF